MPSYLYAVRIKKCSDNIPVAQIIENLTKLGIAQANAEGMTKVKNQIIKKGLSREKASGLSSKLNQTGLECEVISYKTINLDKQPGQDKRTTKISLDKKKEEKDNQDNNQPIPPNDTSLVQPTDNDLAQENQNQPSQETNDQAGQTTDITGEKGSSDNNEEIEKWIFILGSLVAFYIIYEYSWFSTLVIGLIVAGIELAEKNHYYSMITIISFFCIMEIFF